MAAEALHIQLIAIFVLFAASFSGVNIPLLLIKKEFEYTLPLINAMAAGVMLGLAMIHLMPDADEMLKKVTDKYPLGNTISIFGVFLVLMIEQLTVIARNSLLPTGLCDEAGTSHQPYQNPMIMNEHSRSLEMFHESQVLLQRSHSRGSHCEDCHTASFNDILTAKDFKQVLSAYALELSTALHSVVIGFDLGILQQKDLGTVWVLFLALTLHQFVEGLGLGSVMKRSQSQLGDWKIKSFVMVFSSSVSIGVLLGLLCQPSPSSSVPVASSPTISVHSTFPWSLFLQGAITSLAAGSLIYISLVEMTAEYFSMPELEKQGVTKMAMLLCFLLGVVVMAIIGIWT